jgi:hypothetical protein
LETKLIILLAHVVEGRCAIKISTLAAECDSFMAQYCAFISSDLRDCIRNSECLI